jgi:hypothetical protein
MKKTFCKWNVVSKNPPKAKTLSTQINRPSTTYKKLSIVAILKKNKKNFKKL